MSRCGKQEFTREFKCFIRVLDGELRESVYAMPPIDTDGGPLQQISSTKVASGSVSYINDGAGIHQIASDQKTVTLHAYIPGYTTCYAMSPTHADTVILHEMHYQATWDEATRELKMDSEFMPNFVAPPILPKQLSCHAALCEG